MTQYLLDTSVIIDVLNNKRNRPQLIQKLSTQGNDFYYCIINIAEVYAGMHAKEKFRTEAPLDNLDCYYITRDIATLAGKLKREWSKRGITLSISDTLIASVAITHHLVLMTDNKKHYPMPEVQQFEF